VNSRVASSRSAALVAAFYGVAIASAEVCVAFVDVVAGVAVHAVLLLALLNHHLAARRSSNAVADVLVALSLLPLLRIVSVTMVVDDVPAVYRYGIVGAPLLLAVAAADRVLETPRLRKLVAASSGQVLISLSGVPLGLAGYAIVRPQPVSDGVDWDQLLVGSIVLLTFTGLTEELIFRGLLQGALGTAFGWVGVLFASLLFGVMYIGATPAAYVVFITACGLGFAWLVDRTQSVVGVAVAHGLLNVGLILVWPWLFA
jgi:CAAX protease family protein